MTEPAFYSDVLSDVLACLEIDGIVLSRTVVCGAAGVAFDASLSGAMIHIVEQGALEVMNHNDPPVVLDAGGVAFVPMAHAHRVRTAGARRFQRMSQATAKRNAAGLKWVQMGKGPVRAIVASAYFTFRFRETIPILDLLLGWLRVGPEERTLELERVVALLLAEMAEPKAGLRQMSSRLVELVFVCLLRTHIERMDAFKPGLLRGLQDGRLARVMGAVSAAPELQWTLASLAKTANLSPSRLAFLFKASVGTTLLEFVAQWRILKAQHILRREDLSLSEVAERVGYGSDVALSRAFKRITGASPRDWRRNLAERS